MALKSFSKNDTSDFRILFENFGITFYYAQMLEDDLKYILCIAELLGMVSFNRKKDLGIKNTDTDLNKACMGALKDVLTKNKKAGDGDTFYNLLEEANKARRHLAHSFFTEHAIDMLNEAGREAVNQNLSKLYLTIVHAYSISKALCKELSAKAGYTPEMAAQKRAELLKMIDEDINPESS